MRACSACAGDYEDPDRTVWTPDDAEDEDRDERTTRNDRRVSCRRVNVGGRGGEDAENRE